MLNHASFDIFSNSSPFVDNPNLLFKRDISKKYENSTSIVEHKNNKFLSSLDLIKVNNYLRYVLIPFLFSVSPVNITFTNKTTELIDGTILKMTVNPWLRLNNFGFDQIPNIMPQINISENIYYLTYELNFLKGNIEDFTFILENLNNTDSLTINTKMNFENGILKITFEFNGTSIICKNIEIDVNSFQFSEATRAFENWLTVFHRELKKQFNNKLSSYLINLITTKGYQEYIIKD